MAPLARELSVIYGSRTIGGASTTVWLFGSPPYSVDESADEAVFRCHVLVRETAEADFAALVDAVINDLSTPRARLRVVLGSETVFDWNPESADNSLLGFNQEPTCRKAGTPRVDGGRSQLLEFRCPMDLPASKWAQSGRRGDAIASIEFEPSRRATITVEATYTALATEASSYDQYVSAIDAWVTEVATRYGISNLDEPVDESVRGDDIDKTSHIRRTYQEIISNQHLGGLDHDSLVDQSLLVRVVRDFPGDSPNETVNRLVQLSCTYSVWVRKDVTKNLRSLWTSTIRPHLVTSITAAIGASSGALVRDQHVFDHPRNRIEAQLDLLATTGAGLLEYRRSVRVLDIEGVVLRKAWRKGKRFARYRYYGPGDRIRTTTERLRRLSSVAKAKKVGASGGGGGIGATIDGQYAGSIGIGSGSGASIKVQYQPSKDSGTLYSRSVASVAGVGSAKKQTGGGGGGGSGGAGVWELISTDKDATPLRIGDPKAGGAITVIDEVNVTTEEWIEPEGAPSGVTLTGGSGGQLRGTEAGL